MAIRSIIGKTLKPAFKQLAKRSLPKTSGSLSVKGITQQVTVARDELGISHLQASTEEDLFFAQGFVHAQDRLFQMDLNRRVARGMLSEIFGDISFDTDRFARLFGFTKLGMKDFEEMGAQEKNMIKSYVRGINAYLSHKTFRKPIEYSLIGYDPKPWSIEDVMAFSRFMIWQMSHAWFSKLVKFSLLKDLDSKIVDEWEINAPEKNSIILPHGIEFQQYVGELLKTLKGPFLSKSPSSNSIVVSGELTVDGKPILVNDVHLALSTPSLWYEIVLEGPNIHVGGASIPGIPIVLIGQNQKIAWGITLAYTDAADIYLELVNFDTGTYFYKGEETPLEKIETIIPIKNGKGRTRKEKVTYYKNHRGIILPPEIADLQDINPNDLTWYNLPYLDGNWTIAFSVKDFSLEPTKAITGWYQLNRATNWNEFVKSMEKISAPQLNFVYIDSKNIGYWCTGKIPVRKPAGIERYPMPGWTDEFDFNETIPFEEMPHAFNPKSGYIITANNRVVGENYPHYLGNVWMNGYRATRIEQLLIERIQNGKITQEALNEIMQDIYCIPAKELVIEIDKIISSFKLTSEQALLMDYLKNWDFKMDKDQIAPTIYEVLRYELVKELFSSILGTEMCYKVMGIGFHPVLLPASEYFGHDTVVLLRIFKGEGEETLKIYASTKGIEKDEALVYLIKTGLKATSDWLKKKLGSKTKKWQYGKIHQAVFPHALSLEPLLAPIFNAKPFPISGNTDTPYQTAFHSNDPFNNNAWSISFRILSRGSILEESLFTASLGQSENIASHHFSDIVENWSKGKYHQYQWKDLSSLKKLQLLPEEDLL